jgi:hypothetical protein
VCRGEVSFPAGCFCSEPRVGMDDIAATLSSSGHESAFFSLRLWRRRNHFRHRLAKSRDSDRPSGLTELFQHSEAGCPEL